MRDELLALKSFFIFSLRNDEILVLIVNFFILLLLSLLFLFFLWGFRYGKGMDSLSVSRTYILAYLSDWGDLPFHATQGFCHLLMYFPLLALLY